MLGYLRVVALLAGIAAASSFVSAQSAPVASPPVAAEGSPALQKPPANASPGGGGVTSQGASDPVPTLKATAQLVVVDVVVTDRNHKAVRGLKPENFAVTENGVPQAINHMEEHTALTVADRTKFAPMPKLPPGIFTNYTPAPVSGAVNVILLDWLNTPLENQSFAREQFLKYLKTAAPGTRIAVFGLGQRLYLLQGFTTDMDVLKAAFDRQRGKASPLLSDQVGGGGIQNNSTDDLEDQGTVPAFVISNLRQFDAMGETFSIMTRTKYTLDAMNQIARYLSGIPGRKNLLWFSGSFPLDILPDENITEGAASGGGTPGNPFASIGSSEDEFRETVTQLAHSQVSMYPIDVRGVQVSPVFSAATTRNYSGNRRLIQDNAKFLTSQASEHATMEVIAEKTGGRAFYNTNGLTQAVSSAIEDGSNFYTVSYVPTNQALDGRERKIKIKLAVPGAELSYRRGYYAQTQDKHDKVVMNLDTTTDPALGGARQESLRLSMMRGAPTPAEILIKVAVERMSTGGKTEDVVAAGNKLAATTKGPYQRYAVDYAIAPHDLTWIRGDDGKIHIDYDVLVYVYNANGELLNWIGGSHHVSGSMDEMQKGTARGIPCHEEVSVPAAKGEYFLRIGVRDQHRNRYGAIEVATSQVKDVVAANVGPGAPAGGAPLTTPK